MRIKALLASALIALLAACEREAPSPSPPNEMRAENPWRATQPAPAALDSPYNWVQSREAACQHMVEAMGAGANAPTPRSDRDDRDYLPGLGRLPLEPATVADVRAVYGEPCPNAHDAWAAPEAAFAFPNPGATQTFSAVMHASILTLPDGRRIMLAAVTPGDAHVSLGFYGASLVGAPRAPAFVMEGGGTFGFAGKLSAPLTQPLGGYHVWVEGGGTWQGYSQGWVAITDFSGAQPRSLGGFRTYAHFPCRSEPDETQCRGGQDYHVGAIQYSANGPDLLDITWSLETFDEDDHQRQINVHQRTLIAHYELRGGAYRMVDGEEPPSA